MKNEDYERFIDTLRSMTEACNQFSVAFTVSDLPLLIVRNQHRLMKVRVVD